jgi:hypothetical protein
MCNIYRYSNTCPQEKIGQRSLGHITEKKIQMIDQDEKRARCQWIMAVILATQEAGGSWLEPSLSK